jgi:hypothetical protein
MFVRIVDYFLYDPPEMYILSGWDADVPIMPKIDFHISLVIHIPDVFIQGNDQSLPVKGLGHQIIGYYSEF